MSKKGCSSKKSVPPFRQKFKKHDNRHHVYPTSRFVLKKNSVLHTAWHDVFRNSTPEEAIKIVQRWRLTPEKFKEEILNSERRISAWKMLFGDSAEFDEIIIIIQKDWTFPGVKMIKT